LKEYRDKGYEDFIMVVNEKQLQTAFTLALVLGAASIYLGWHINSLLLTIILPVAVMMAYLAWAIATDKAIVKTHSYADSLYFLGFLLTLVALAVSLFDFMKEEADNGLEGTVLRFGCALITTIVGLTCRILLVNFQKEMPDNVKELEASFTLTVSKFRDRLRNLTQTLRKQGDLFQEAVTDILQKTTTQLDTVISSSKETMSGNVSDFGNTVLETGEVIVLSSKEMGDRIRNTSLPEDVFAQQLSEPLRNLQTKIQEVNNALGESSITQQNVLEAAEKIKDSLINLTDVSEMVTGFVSSLSESSQEMRELVTEIGKMKSVLTESLESQREIVSELNEKREAHAKSFAEIEAMKTALQQNVKESADALQLTQQHLVESAKFIISNLKAEEQSE